jgi:hypothetical protein
MKNGAKVDIKNNQGYTPLKYALKYYKSLSIINPLLTSNAKINEKNNKGEAALSIALNLN